MSDCRKCDHKSICIEWWNQGIELDIASEAVTSFGNYGNVECMNELWGISCTDYEGYRTPMKPHYESDGDYNGEPVYDTWICPRCSKRYEADYDEYDYCPNCGQAIDWT